MRALVSLLFVLFICYFLLLSPFTLYLNNRLFEEKLGYLPQKEIVSCLAADHRQLVGALVLIKVIYYFGGILEKQGNKLNLTSDYTTMARFIRTANYLDPYNADLYYFTQAAFAQGENGTRFVNDLLQNGMKYRIWDVEIPFFAGFNAAFTLKDYKKAAEYMKRSSELTGDPLYSSLAVKFFNQAGETDFGILFMASMEKDARDEKIRRLYHDKKNLLIASKKISLAVNAYQDRYHHLPRDLNELVRAGFLAKIPRDPFGGAFYLSPEGTVESSSGNLTLRIH